MERNASSSEKNSNPVAHWFFSPDAKVRWTPFSASDNLKLENALKTGQQHADVFGRRFKVDIASSSLQSIYWDESEKSSVRRSWWCYAASSHEFVPLSTKECEIVEAAYLKATSSNSWPVVIDLPAVGRVIMESSAIIKFYPIDESDAVTRLGDVVDLTTDATKAEQIMIASLSVGMPLKRGFDSDFYAGLPPNEPDTFDHLVLVVHGIGGYCDLRFRSLPECVNDMRTMTQRLCLDHSITDSNPSSPPPPPAANTSDSSSSSNNMAAESSFAAAAERSNSIEFLPVQWHSALHRGPDGLNEKLNRISLESCGKIRNFVNDVLLDVLLFTSPAYHQAIIENVVSEINRVYALFQSRHPSFSGQVSLIGHSLGSVIVFDILSNQPPASWNTGAATPSSMVAKMSLGPCHSHNNDELQTKLDFEPFVFFAFGSPLAMFLTVSGVNSIPADYSLTTCKQVYNIFHPFDPVAYRIEPLIQQQQETNSASSPSLISPPPPFVVPHHRGRKRLHLEVKDVVTKIGDVVRQRVVESIQSMAVFFKRTRSASSMFGDHQAADMATAVTEAESSLLADSSSTLVEPPPEQKSSAAVASSQNYNFGQLNGNQRLDYVLQETPIEVVNPYIFSIASHLCYWTSEDALLFIARALYGVSSTTSSTQS